jgi:hypothetical protein
VIKERTVTQLRNQLATARRALGDELHEKNRLSKITDELNAEVARDAKSKRDKSFDKLVAIMREHKQTRYLDESVDPPLEVQLDEGKVKIKLRRRKSEVPPPAAAGLD